MSNDNLNMSDLTAGMYWQADSFCFFFSLGFIEKCLFLCGFWFVALNVEDRAGLVNALKVSFRLKDWFYNKWTAICDFSDFFFNFIWFDDCLCILIWLLFCLFILMLCRTSCRIWLDNTRMSLRTWLPLSGSVSRL